MWKENLKIQKNIQEQLGKDFLNEITQLIKENNQFDYPGWVAFSFDKSSL